MRASVQAVAQVRVRQHPQLAHVLQLAQLLLPVRPLLQPVQLPQHVLQVAHRLVPQVEWV